MRIPPKGPNRNLNTVRPGDSLSSVINAKSMQSLQGGVTRANQMVYGPGDNKLFLGPYTLTKARSSPSTASASIVHFTITDFDCADTDDDGHHYATATVTFVACGLEDPEVDDEIDVYDLMGCWLDDAEALLIGRKGIAFKVEHSPNIYDTCAWSIFSLCQSNINC